MTIETKKKVLFGAASVIVIIIIFVLVPLFLQYQKRSKTEEARTNLRVIYDYLLTDAHSHCINNELPRDYEFPTTMPKLTKAQRYTYNIIARGRGADAAFTARATGDLDEDGVTSLFERVGFSKYICEHRNLEDALTAASMSGAGLYTEKDLE